MTGARVVSAQLAGRSKNLYIVWRDYQRRAEALAPLLDADVVFLPHRFRSRWLRPLDYLAKAARTTALLLRRRPGFAVFQSPPHFGALIAAVLGVPYVIDAHNATIQGRWARMPGAALALASARAVMVHNDEIAVLTRKRFPKARLVVASDPVPELPGAGQPGVRHDSRVLLICSFAADEPVDVILDVIAGAPELTFIVTADPGKLTPAARERLLSLPNVELTGFVPVADYQRLLATSKAAVVLSTRPATQPSGACEALSSDTPLVVSRSTLTEDLFGSWASVVDNTSDAILAALRDPSLSPRDLSAEREAWNRRVSAASAETVRLATARRVLMIVENLPVPFDRRVWLEATALREAGYEVTVICPKGKGHDADHEVIEGIRVYRHSLPPETGSKLDYLREYASALWHEFRLAARARREHGFDIVHICNPPDLLFLVAGFWKLWGRAKVVFDHHDVGPELYVEKFGRRDILYRALRWAERLTFATADVVVSTNESYRSVALERGGKAAADAFVVRSAPDLTAFRPLPANAELKRGARYLVGYVGVMAEQDGVDRLIRAARRIVHDLGRDDVRFMLIGGGPSLQGLKRLAVDLEVEAHVEFAGFRTGDDLLTRLSTCDVCVSPDPPTEYNRMCTMNKVMEYMALGKPIVQFDLDEGRVSAAGASLYASDEEEFADMIVSLLDDEGARHEMGELGRMRMTTALGWRHQVPKLLAAYERLLA